MTGRRRRTSAAQHHLAGHELAVVFADRAGRFAIARVGDVGTRRPLPDLAGALKGARRDLPLGFARKPLARPFGKGGSLEGADMADRPERIDRFETGQGEDVPGAVPILPIKGRLPSALIYAVLTCPVLSDQF
jgi:hypothetical protein